METASIFASSLRRELVPGGARLIYESSDETFRGLTDFVLFERKCCSSLSYTLESSTPHDQIVFTIAGPGGTEDAVRKWCGIAPQSGASDVALSLNT